jgi:uncharacterized protein
MTEAEFLRTIRLNRINAALLDRLAQLQVQQAHLVASALFGTVWNVASGQPPEAHIRDYDVFYWDADTSDQAEDAVIRRAEALFADLQSPVPIQVRNQARVHLWFTRRYGLGRPPLTSVQDGIRQFLVACTCLGVDRQGQVYAPRGLADLRAGRLRRNPANHTPSLYAAKAADYQQRWPWLKQVGDEG